MFPLLWRGQQLCGAGDQQGHGKGENLLRGYTEEKYSELPYAQKFSQTIGVENISNKVSADEFFNAVPEIQYMLDEPLPNPRRSPCISWPRTPGSM